MADPPYQSSISRALDDALDNHRDARERYREGLWDALGDDGKRILKTIEATAQTLIEGAGSLSIAVPAFEVLRELRSADKGEPATLIPALLEQMEYLLGLQVIGMIDRAENRILDLLILAAAFQPSRRGRSFLRRVSRCYLFGFDVECVVMCRSVLDAEFAFHVPADKCLQTFPQLRRKRKPGSKQPLVDLWHRIETAKELRWIDLATASKAHKTRKDGNEIVHSSPALRVNALSYISDTLAVIRELGDKER
jgi:hypothetical protein